MRLKILGIGSPFGADRIGWDVAEALLAHRPQGRYTGGELHIESCDRPGIGLLDHLRGCDEAWIVDALLGDRTGGLRWLAREDLALAQESFSSHNAGVAEALALGAALGGDVPKVRVLAVEVAAGQRSPPPDSVNQAVRELSSRLQATLGEPDVG